MIKLQYLDKYIEEQLLEENAKERENHEPSGKLSASRLGQPTQWQVLHTIGVPSEDLEEYAIRKFKRGNHAEDWLVGRTPGLINKQKFVEYRDTVGFVDAIVDMRDWNLEYGTIPHEIKSVANSQFKWIQRDGAKDSHILQGCLYALALEAEHFVINYLATDDYRIETFLFETKEHKKKVDDIIDTYNEARKSGFVPAFQAREKWQENNKYNSFSRFKDMGPIEIDQVLEREYPEAFKKLKEYNAEN